MNDIKPTKDLIRKEKEFFESLEILLAKLKGVDFALVGTFNLFVQGVRIDPRDLDLLTDDEGIKKISQIFGSEIVEDREDHYKETGFQIGGVEVQVISNKGNPLRPGDFQEHIIWIEKEGLEVPCMSLQSELTFYRQLGRGKDRKKVQLIEEKLNNDRMIR